MYDGCIFDRLNLHIIFLPQHLISNFIQGGTDIGISDSPGAEWSQIYVHICDFMGNSITRVFPEVEEEAEGVKDGLEIDKEPVLLKSGSVRATWLQGRERDNELADSVCVFEATLFLINPLMFYEGLSTVHCDAKPRAKKKEKK